jgi:hypothetical protein
VPTTNTTVSLAGATGYSVTVSPAAGTLVVGVTAFDPSDIPGLRLWLTAGPAWCFKDAAGTLPCGDGDPVALWRDRSGHGFDLTQANAGDQPVLKADGAGGWCVELDGVTDRMAGLPPVTAVPCSLAVRVQPTGAATTRTPYGVCGDSDDLETFEAVVTNDRHARARQCAGGDSALATTTTVFAAGGWASVAAAFAANDSRAAYLDGAGKAANAGVMAPAQPITTANLGRRSNFDNQRFAGRVRSVLAYAAALTDAQVAQLAAGGY